MRAEEFRANGAVAVSFLDSPSFTHLEEEWSFLPYSDMRQWIPERDTWFDIQSSFPLGRLHRIKQLSFLSYVGANSEMVYFTPYVHTRFLHTQQVAFAGYAEAMNNGLGFDEAEKIKIMFSLHDIATVAHGDAIKRVDPANLNEENHWRDVVGQKGFDFLEKKGIKPEEVDATLVNHGVNGKLLDVTDRICYTIQDAYEILGGSDFSKIDIHPYLVQLRYMLSHQPELGNIYKDIGIDRKNGDIVFADKDRLSILLLLRAHLHQKLYLNPISIGRDTFISRLTKPFYSPDGSKPLSPAVLMDMCDEELIEFLKEQYGYGWRDMWIDLVNWHPKSVKLESLYEAKAEEQKLREAGYPVIGSGTCHGFDAGTEYNVIEKTSVEPLREVGSVVDSGVIENIARDTEGSYVFYTEPDNLAVRKLLERVEELEKVQ